MFDLRGLSIVRDHQFDLIAAQTTSLRWFTCFQMAGQLVVEGANARVLDTAEIE
jgi:hypothetical protein